MHRAGVRPRAEGSGGVGASVEGSAPGRTGGRCISLRSMHPTSAASYSWRQMNKCGSSGRAPGSVSFRTSIAPIMLASADSWSQAESSRVSRSGQRVG